MFVSEELSGIVLGGDGRLDLRQVHELVAERARTTPGVVRLEPSLGQSLSRFAGSGLRAAATRLGRERRPDPADGVHVTVGPGPHQLTVRVDVVVDARASIAVVGQEIRTGVIRLLTEAGFTKPTVNIAVLAVAD